MLYLGPYIWETGTSEDPIEMWAPPTRAFSVVDLRPSSARGQRGGVPQGFAVFKGPAGLPAEYMPLGRTPDTLLRTAQRRDWGVRLGFSSPMEARTIGEAIWETLTWRADPSGQSNAKPLIPTTQRRLELHVAGAVRRRKFSPKMREFNSIQATLRNDYRKIRASVLNRDSLPLNERMPINHHRKILGAWRLKYGIDDMRVFIPPDLSLEPAESPATQADENFNRPDATPLGISSDGDWSWTEIVGNIDIVSNQAKEQLVNGASMERADKDLSSSDNYAQSKYVAVSSNARLTSVFCRKDSSATKTFYAAEQTGNLNKWQSVVYVDWTPTIIGVTTSAAPSLPQTLKIEANGSTIRRLLDDVEQDSVSDAIISSGLRGGLYTTSKSFGTAAIFDDFEMADLVAASGNPYYAYAQM